MSHWRSFAISSPCYSRFRNFTVAEMNDRSAHAQCPRYGLWSRCRSHLAIDPLRALSTTIPVWESSAPVGSSHRKLMDFWKWRGQWPRVVVRHGKLGGENDPVCLLIRPGQERLRGHWIAGNFGYNRHILSCRQTGNQIVELENKSDMKTAVFCQFFSLLCQIPASVRNKPLVAVSSRHDINNVDLPLPTVQEELLILRHRDPYQHHAGREPPLPHFINFSEVSNMKKVLQIRSLLPYK